MKHGATYDLSKATVAASSGGFDLTKSAQTPDARGRANLSLTTGGKQSPVTSTDHPLAKHSPGTKARYSPKSAKGRAKMKAAFDEVTANEPKAVAATRRKKGARAAGRQKVAIALSKARRAGVRIPRKG